MKKLSNWLRSQSRSWANPAWGSWWSITLHFWSSPFGISILYQYLKGHFWPNSTLFQGLENRFRNSILSIPCWNPAFCTFCYPLVQCHLAH